VPNLPNWAYLWFNPFLELEASDGFVSDALQALVDPASQPSPVRLLADPDAYLHRIINQGHIGERMATWAAWSAPAGFEYRYPLTDRRLWEFMLGLPAALRFGHGRPRWLARKAFADRLPKGLSKADVANEKRRHDARMQWWRMLARDAQQGRFDEPCDWLDMKRFKKTLTDPMPQDERLQIITFIHIFVAMRVWAMHRRQTLRSV
jgi:asparagine synthase (glutamine-hydrolysing)